MKKIVSSILISLLLLIPVKMNAEIKSETLIEALEKENIETKINYKESKEQVTIYFFRIQGETKSRNFLNYLNSIYDRYGMFFKVRIYEVSQNEDNMKLLENTFDYLGGEHNGAPFILIGSTYFVTYNDTVNDNIVKSFTEAYLGGNKVDTVKEVLTKYYRNYTLILSIVFALVIGLTIVIVVTIINNKKENKQKQN